MEEARLSEVILCGGRNDAMKLLTAPARKSLREVFRWACMRTASHGKRGSPQPFTCSFYLVYVTCKPCKSDTAKPSMLATGNNSTFRYLMLSRITVIFDHDEYSVYDTCADSTYISYGILNEQRKTLVGFAHDEIQAGKVYKSFFSGNVGIERLLLYKMKHNISVDTYISPHPGDGFTCKEKDILW